MCIRCGPENWVKRFHKVEDLLDAFRGYNCQGNTQESLLCPLMPNKKYKHKSDSWTYKSEIWRDDGIIIYMECLATDKKKQIQTD